jgi:hypothetical protein
MAERAIPTALLFQSVSKLLKGDAPATFSHLSLCTESMAAYSVDTTTFGSELTRQAVTPTLETITKTDDTVTMSKSSWTPGASTVYGAGVFTALTGSYLQIFHEWAASVTFEASDTLTQTIKLQSKQGS